MVASPHRVLHEIDKLEISLRFGKDNYYPMDIIRDVAHHYERMGRTVGACMAGRYSRNSSRYLRYRISLGPHHKEILFVESGIAHNRSGAYPYAKFAFNAARLLLSAGARAEFHTVLNDFVPGGFGELAETGFVVYAEFAIDFIGAIFDEIDAYHPHMNYVRRFPPQGNPSSLILRPANLGLHELAYSIYDKKRECFENPRLISPHLRRYERLRVEAKRRFNHTPQYREIRLAELASIANAWDGLFIVDRSEVHRIFTANRHRRFNEVAGRDGLQAAFAGTRGADRDRRVRMLGQCQVDWWNSDALWAGFVAAVSKAMNL